jgi:hypothetical protein
MSEVSWEDQGDSHIERTHTALGGITPMEALINNLHGNHT